MSTQRLDVELEAALVKVRAWHESVKNVINEEADQWLTDLEILAAKLIAFHRDR